MLHSLVSANDNRTSGLNLAPQVHALETLRLEPSPLGQTGDTPPNEASEVDFPRDVKLTPPKLDVIRQLLDRSDA